jgi:putative hemolysin
LSRARVAAENAADDATTARAGWCPGSIQHYRGTSRREGERIQTSTLNELIIIVALTVAGGVFAGAEIAVVALRKTRVQELLEENRSGARAVAALKDQPERFLATVQVGITVIGATAAAFGGAAIAAKLTPYLERISWAKRYADDMALGVVVLGVSFLSIVVGELVPKSLALRSAERYALLIGKPLLGLSWLARPIVWLLSSSANLVLRPFGDTTTFTEARHSAEELQQIVEEATRAGTIHPEAGEIAARALELPELRVADVMVPRQEVILVPHDASFEQLVRVAQEHQHSRVPVYEGRADNVLGYLSMKDLLPRALDQKSLIAKDLMRPPYFVPDSKQAVELLKEMRQRRQPFAIVVDEQGGLAGIVTIEDLVEELVGEIFSEHTRKVPQLIKKEEGGSAIVSGTTPIREINRSLGVELPEEGDYTTVAGLSLSLAGKVPSAGEVLPLPNGVTLEMVDVSPRRVRTVRVRPAPPAADANDGPGTG